MFEKLSRISLLAFSLFILGSSQYQQQIQGDFFQGERIGILYVSHGGNETYGEKQLWDATMQIFSYDQNSPVYQQIIWNSDYWPQMLKFGNASKELGKYAFEYERIGGVDPYPESKRQTTAELSSILDNYENELGVDFIVDKMTWISPDPSELANPRMLFNPGIPGGDPLRYCGTTDPTWHLCDPDRYNVDGPVERMLKIGVDRIVMIDLTTAGARFSKTYDVYTTAKKVIRNYNKSQQTDVTIEWVNDPKELMLTSYPTEPKGWTRSSGSPKDNPIIDYGEYPNPVIGDLRLAQFQVDGIEAEFDAKIALENTGVLLVNHGILSMNQVFDPKINDTLILNQNIKDLLLEKFPEMQSKNILGGWFGDMVRNELVTPGPPAFTQLERSREMRGENLGYILLHDTQNQRPQGDWKFRYWQALEQLRINGVQHIVVVFPQIMENSVLNLVEVPNQIAKEIGYRNWSKIDQLDFTTYPEVGHPFADYWGVWVEQTCKVSTDSKQKEPCCFNMGGCPNGQPYPPLRQAPLHVRRDDLDPSLAFDVSHFGHLGYDSEAGMPSEKQPVQNQYAGTWSMWQVTDDHRAVAEFLADKIVEHLKAPTTHAGRQ